MTADTVIVDTAPRTREPVTLDATVNVVAACDAANPCDDDPLVTSRQRDTANTGTDDPLARGKSRPTLTLSAQQAGILRIAYAVNAHTQGGRAACKLPGGPTVDPTRWRVPVALCAGCADYATPLGVHLLHGVEFSRVNSRGSMDSQHFQRTAAANSAIASASRAATSLEKRGLLIYRPPANGYGCGYVLSASGLAIARRLDPLPIADADLLLRWAGIIPWPGKECWERAKAQHATPARRPLAGEPVLRRRPEAGR